MIFGFCLTFCRDFMFSLTFVFFRVCLVFFGSATVILVSAMFFCDLGTDLVFSYIVDVWRMFY